MNVAGEPRLFSDVTTEMFESMFIEEANAYIALDREYYGCFWNAVEYPPPPMEVADSRAAGRLGELDPAMADEAPLAYAAQMTETAAATAATALAISESKSPSDKSDKSDKPAKPDKPVKLKDRSIAERKASAGVTHVGSHTKPGPGHSQKWRSITKQRKKIPIPEDHVRLDMAKAVAAIEGNFQNGGGKFKPMIENKDDWRLRKKDGTLDTRPLYFFQMHPPYGGWHLYVPSTYPDDRFEVGGTSGDSNYQHINTRLKRDCLLDPEYCKAGEELTMQQLQSRALERTNRIEQAQKQKATDKGRAAIKAGKSLNGSARPRESIDD